MKIEELGLSARAFNGLKRAKIDTVEQLQQLTDEDLLTLRTIGVNTLSEIREKVAYVKTMTNADRIRSMSDEELAKYITDRTMYQPAPGSRKSWCGAYGNSYLEYHEAALDWLYWLQQPAVEDQP